MKIVSHSSRPSRHGFSYVELLIASTVLLFVLLALASSNVFSMRIGSLVTQQLDEVQERNRIKARISADIQLAQRITVGSGDFATVTKPSGPYVGNAMELEIVNGGVTNSVIYYQGTGQLRRAVNDVTPTELIVDGVMNTNTFMAVDPTSIQTNWQALQPLTNDTSRMLVRVFLQMSQLGGQSLSDGTGVDFADNELEFSVVQKGVAQ